MDGERRGLIDNRVYDTLFVILSSNCLPMVSYTRCFDNTR